MPADRLDIMWIGPAPSEGKKGFWYKLGTAFINRDGTGYSGIIENPFIPGGTLRFQMLDPNRFGNQRTGVQQNWQSRPAPGPARYPTPRAPMPIDQGPPPNNGADDDDGWPGPR